MGKFDLFLDKCITAVFKNISESKKKTLIQFIKFGFVGLSNTLLSYALYMITIWALKPLHFAYDYVVGNLVGFFLSVLWSFFWNNKHVFTVEEGRKRNWVLALLKTYMSYAFTGILLTNVLSYLWVDIIGLPKEVAPLINLVITVPLNFIINKFWAFSTRKKKPDDKEKEEEA
ncbi:MAG: GtrA family protein [Lachnospiraceae bacterium]|nr:GtrA family protein [Lachnospiraceae bacterium]